MERRFTNWPAYSSLLLLLAFLAALLVSHAAADGNVRVGVILDMASVAGTRFQTSIQMAMEDFYAAHPNSTTRIELHFRDSSSDAVIGSVSAAVDLIKNTQVQAIIGPQTSAASEFVAQLGNRTRVPVLSYSATSSSGSTTPYLVRTCAADSFQAAPIADVVDHFEWRQVILIHEDSSTFGAGIVTALDDALRGAGAGAGVAHRAAVPADASDDRLDAVLYRVKAMITRVYVVHVSPALALRLFRRAKDAGMMAEGYVWIATAGVGDDVLISPEDMDAMQGVISVRAYVQPTSRVDDFAGRFKARLLKQLRNDAGSDEIHDPTVSTLWAYDTAWAVAAAAEASKISGPGFESPQPQGSTATELDQLGVSSTGAKLLNAVLGTSFDGLAGKFRLVHGRLQAPAYEIVNFAGGGGGVTTVGYWTGKSGGISQEFDLKSGGEGGLKRVVWPGGGNSDIRIPGGWAVSPLGQELVIAVPVKHGFHQFVQVYNDTTTNQTMISGYCIDVFDAAIKALPYPVYYRYEPYYGIGSSDSYDQLVELVPQQKADAVVGDVAITVGRMAVVDFTLPFTESGWSMVVAMQSQTSTSMFFFMKPLTPGLWVVSLAAFIFTGFVIWVIEHRINPEFRGTPMQQFGTIFHYAFSTLVFAHRENVQSNLSKFLMVIWVFAVLILTSSYTASLTTMLTVQKLNPSVTDISDLLNNGDYVGYQEGSFVAEELVKMNFDPSKLRSYSTPDEYADALSKGSDNGGVTAVFDEVPYLKLFLSQYCDGYTMTGPIYKGTGLGFVFPNGSPMVQEVSRAIVGLTEGDDMGLIERKWFGAPGTCGDGVDTSSASLTLRNFSGLFLITGVASSLMLIIYLLMFAYSERHELRAAEPSSGSVSLKRLRAWMQHYDRKDMSAPQFKQQQSWGDSSSRNGSHGKQSERAEQEEVTPARDFPGASPLSNHSRMESAPSLERKLSSEFRTPFEQRMGDTAAASTDKRSSTPERRPSLKLPEKDEERKPAMLSP
ncbi:hypothetical protein PR202_ga03175 [Eleusine coracana subsp. coracana]|uniref:Ionotropic glutamate receptor C-terminal domain-containing protein n=1 Tax=Eleusine coracana subsp. coracana TaxID=191504 RepID=A0AAV5BLQ4_ELECO|nr:hypothetical protein QOZ80_2BG0203820 [Eleusine coracana subsp. coracana]GJM87240.1 hypothetical protein PR202_ga03175 [Eleusine coracana subsp. coracana]